MGKANRQRAEGMVDENIKKNNAQTASNAAMLDPMLKDAQAKSNDAYSGASEGYKSAQGPTGAYDPTEYAKVSGQNDQNVATGGYDAEKLKQLRDTNTQFVSTGGYDPNDVAKVNKGYGDLTAGGTGGMDMSKIRGGYQEMASTGGIDEATANAMRRQSASGVQSVYSTMGQNLARKTAAQGMGGGGGETAEMARQMANQQGTAITGVNAEVGKLRQTGKIAGLGGLTTAESAAASGQREAVKGEADFAGSQATNRGLAQGRSQDLETSKAAGTLKASQAEQDLATGVADQKLKAAGGLAQLYSSDPGYVTSMVKSILQSQQQGNEMSTQQTQIMQQLAAQPGLFTTIMSTVAQMGGMAGGIMTGVGALKVPKKG
jgi:hypothetical protein